MEYKTQKFGGPPGQLSPPNKKPLHTPDRVCELVFGAHAGVKGKAHYAISVVSHSCAKNAQEWGTLGADCAGGQSYPPLSLEWTAGTPVLSINLHKYDG